MLGVGPGALPTDARMIGLSQSQTRDLLEQSLGVIMQLLTSDEPVTFKNDRWDLQEAQLHLKPYSNPLFDICTAAVASPAGPRLGGRHGVGLLSIPTMPQLDGIDDFKGDSFHTFHWPHEGYDLTGKKVGIIGTGATAIQVIGDIADKVGSLHVFQRRANWAAPLNNSKITPEQMADIRRRYDQIFEVCARTPGGFEHEPDRRGFWEVSREEREKLWNKLYKEPGFGIWLANFREIFMDEKANAEFSEWIADRIRERVKDPVTAEKLIPRDHGFGVQRVPLETYYYEAYNRDNVHLVDLNEEKLVRATESGLQTEANTYDFDVIIYATGFDAITGAYDRIDITGANGVKLRDKWETRITTYLGMFIEGFPNLLMPNGPQSGSAATNYPRGIEIGVATADL